MHIVETIRSIKSFDGSIGSGTLPSKCPWRSSFCKNIASNESYDDDSYLLEDNLMMCQPFVDDWMHKLTQMEESIVQHSITDDLWRAKSMIH